jgi:hypothetical protein
MMPSGIPLGRPLPLREGSSDGNYSCEGGLRLGTSISSRLDQTRLQARVLTERTDRAITCHDDGDLNLSGRERVEGAPSLKAAAVS